MDPGAITLEPHLCMNKAQLAHHMVPNLPNKYITVNTQMSTCINDAGLQHLKENIEI